MTGRPVEALAFGEAVLPAHDKALGASHTRTIDSARITADTLVELGCVEAASAIRVPYRIGGQFVWSLGSLSFRRYLHRKQHEPVHRKQRTLGRWHADPRAKFERMLDSSSSP